MKVYDHNDLGLKVCILDSKYWKNFMPKKGMLNGNWKRKDFNYAQGVIVDAWKVFWDGWMSTSYAHEVSRVLDL